MKFQITTLVSFLMLLGLSTAAKGKTPKPPGLEFLYSVNITGGEAAIVGAGPRGLRIVVPILTGAFSGPKLKGIVLPIGGDWALIDISAQGNNTVTPDVRQTFQTDDGAVIQVWETGRTVAADTAYVTLNYETGSEKYYWINKVVAVGILKTTGGNGLTIDTWQMTAP